MTSIQEQVAALDGTLPEPPKRYVQDNPMKPRGTPRNPKWNRRLLARLARLVQEITPADVHAIVSGNVSKAVVFGFHPTKGGRV